MNNVIGIIDVNDHIGQKHEANIALELNKLDDEYLDDYKANVPKSFRQVMTRSDITIGAVSKPSVTITLPYITPEERNEQRAKDDILKETLNYQAHVTPGSSEPLWKVEIVNEIETYLPDDES